MIALQCSLMTSHILVANTNVRVGRNMLKECQLVVLPRQ